MTIVIARKIDKRYHISADTMLTPGVDRGISDSSLLIPGALKVFVISSDICFACSGVHENAVMALREIFQMGCNDNLRKVRNILIAVSRASKGKTDFLLCHSKKGLCKIVDGNVQGKRRARLFLGNDRAIALCDSQWSNLHGALTSTDTQLQSIGGLELTACVKSCGHFHYVSGVDASLTYGCSKHKTGPKWHGMNEDKLTIVRIGEFSVSSPFFTLYFPDAQFGYIYDYLKHDKPLRIEANNVTQFGESVLAESGKYVKVESNYITVSQPGREKATLRF